MFENWRLPPRMQVPPALSAGEPPPFVEPQYDVKGAAVPYNTPPPGGAQVSSLKVQDAIPYFPQVHATQFFRHRAPQQPCTRACGGGWALQPTACVSVTMHTTAPLDVCMEDLALADDRIAPCAQEQCDSAEAHWETQDWSPSSERCDGGLQERVMRCMRNGLQIEAADCGELEQPVTMPSCTTPCINFGWYAGAWSDCSAQCGWGRRSRSIECVDLNNATAPAEFCPYARPDVEGDCHLEACASEAGGENGSTAQANSPHAVVPGQEAIKCALPVISCLHGQSDRLYARSILPIMRQLQMNACPNVSTLTCFAATCNLFVLADARRLESTGRLIAKTCNAASTACARAATATASQATAEPLVTSLRAVEAMLCKMTSAACRRTPLLGTTLAHHTSRAAPTDSKSTSKACAVRERWTGAHHGLLRPPTGGAQGIDVPPCGLFAYLTHARERYHLADVASATVPGHSWTCFTTAARASWMLPGSAASLACWTTVAFATATTHHAPRPSL